MTLTEYAKKYHTDLRDIDFVFLGLYEKYKDIEVIPITQGFRDRLQVIVEEYENLKRMEVVE